MLYRMRFVRTGDLADDWADCGGLAAQFNIIAIVTGMSITDRPAVALKYDRRLHRHIRKLAQNRAISSDYFPTLSAAHPDIKAGVLRDFEFNAGLIKKEKESEKAKQEKNRTDTQRRIRRTISAIGGQTTIGRPGRRTIGRNKRPRRTRRKRGPREETGEEGAW